MTIGNLDGLGGGLLQQINPTDQQNRGTDLAQSLTKFDDAMRNATAPGQTEGSYQVAQVTTANDATPVGAVEEPTVADRAVAGLNLDPRTETTGQSILSGLERLRGVFDTQYSALNGNVTGVQMDVGQMMALQAEVVKYSVLVDVTSKLAGKSTQAMDSLMKGQ